MSEENKDCQEVHQEVHQEPATEDKELLTSQTAATNLSDSCKNLGDSPAKVICPYCKQSVQTYTKMQNGILSYLISLMIIIILGSYFWICFFLIFTGFIITKTQVHKCSECDQTIGTDGKIFYYLNVKDTVVSLKVGEVGCILTKKVILTIISVVLLIIAISVRANIIITHQQSYSHSHLNDLKMYVNVDWKNFLDQCEIVKIIADEQINQYCMDNYMEKTFQKWSGYVIKVEDYRSENNIFLHHAIQILIQMDPVENLYYIDILMTMDSEQVDQNVQVIESLKRGQKIGFDATMKYLGSPMQSRHMHCTSIWIENGFKDIQPHVNIYGRYKDQKLSNDEQISQITNGTIAKTSKENATLSSNSTSN